MNGWIFSELLNENFKLIYKNEILKKVMFSKGAVYSLEEIQAIKDLSGLELKQIHSIKTLTGGWVRMTNNKVIPNYIAR